jgi:hypothetical protein
MTNGNLVGVTKGRLERKHITSLSVYISRPPSLSVDGGNINDPCNIVE